MSRSHTGVHTGTSCHPILTTSLSVARTRRCTWLQARVAAPSGVPDGADDPDSEFGLLQNSEDLTVALKTWSARVDEVVAWATAVLPVRHPDVFGPPTPANIQLLASRTRWCVALGVGCGRRYRVFAHTGVAWCGTMWQGVHRGGYAGIRGSARG